MNKLDDQFDLLSDGTRRRLLAELVDDPATDGGVSAPLDPTTLEGADAVALHHVHLPKLDEAGYVSWNREAGTVTKGAAFDEIEPLFGLVLEHGNRSLPWKASV